jgi:alpha-L-rhamnosidase
MKNYFILFFSLVLLFSCNQKEQDFSVVHLQCEYLNDAIGIDAESPRFSWEQRSEVNGFTQTTYHIIIGENASFSSGSILWDSGKQFSDLNHCAYAGQELKPFTKYFWQVTVGNADGAEAKSEVASFETGMMGMKNWKGSWITDTRDINLKPAPYFRKELAIEKDIKTARAYIAVAGLYELSVNGQRIGDHRLDPTYTRFDRRTLYVTYDVTAQLKSGQNAIGVLLGNGWYNHQSTAVWYFHEAVWRARPKFCMDLRLEYDDGSIETIGTDATWKTDLSPVVFNSIYTAEHYDARLEQPGWNQSGFDDAHWRNAILTPTPSNNIVAQSLRPIRNVEKISPISRDQEEQYQLHF